MPEIDEEDGHIYYSDEELDEMMMDQEAEAQEEAFDDHEQGYDWS